MVLRYARLGKWDELRAAHTEKAMEIFRLASTSQIEDSIDIEIKKQAFRNMQDELFLARLASHYEKYGHLSMVDVKTGQELLDPSGFPIPLRIPHTIKAAHELIQALQKSLEEQVAKSKAIEEEKRVAGAKVVSVTDYEHLFKSSGEDEGPANE